MKGSHGCIPREPVEGGGAIVRQRYVDLLSRIKLIRIYGMLRLQKVGDVFVVGIRGVGE